MNPLFKKGKFKVFPPSPFHPVSAQFFSLFEILPTLLKLDNFFSNPYSSAPTRSMLERKWEMSIFPQTFLFSNPFGKNWENIWAEGRGQEIGLFNFLLFLLILLTKIH
jgi:hypothetical protein